MILAINTIRGYVYTLDNKCIEISSISSRGKKKLKRSFYKKLCNNGFEK